MLLPFLVGDGTTRTAFREMLALARTLPARMRNPLPETMQALTPSAPAPPGSLPGERLTDLAARTAGFLAGHRHLGLCARTALVRYHFLRRLGVPVDLHFGARFIEGKADRDITGHAWLSLNGTPYREPAEHVRGFTTMLTYPRDLPAPTPR